MGAAWAGVCSTGERWDRCAPGKGGEGAGGAPDLYRHAAIGGFPEPPPLLLAHSAPVSAPLSHITWTHIHTLPGFDSRLSLISPPAPISALCTPSPPPPLQALVSVSTIGTQDQLTDAQLEAAVREQLAGWFGAAEVGSWSHLRTYRIPFAQPNQVSGLGAGTSRRPHTAVSGRRHGSAPRVAARGTVAAAERASSL